MNFKKFLAVFLCAVMTLSTVGVMAADAAEVPTEYTISEITGDALNITAVPAYIAIENPSNLESAETVEYALDLGLSFEAGETDEEAKTKPYYSYVCDFELTFDHDVTALLAGQYDMFSDKWIAVNAASDTEYELGGKTYDAHIDGVDFKANEPVRIMSFIDDKYTYRDAIAIQKFNCGVKFAYDVPNGIKAKLELVMNPTIEVTSSDEYDYSMRINGDIHYYKVDRDTKYVITSNEFTYNNNTHGITTDTTDAVKVENLNNDVESITTPEVAVGATHLIESLEQSAKDDIAPEVVIAIAQNTTGAANDAFNGTVADVVYNLTPSTTVTVVEVTNTAMEEPALAEGAVVVEVTVTDDNNGGAELTTVPAPIVVGIPVADASKVKKVLHLHDGVLEDVKFTTIDNVVYIQMSKFSQVAIIEDTAPTYSVTVNVSGSGSASANVTEAIEGEQVELTVTPDANYALSSLTVTDADGNAVAVTDNKFEMPAADVTVNVAFITTVSRPSASVGGTGSTTPVKVTVKFDTNGGSEIEDVKVEKGEAVEAPKAPEKENNIFIGWFADKDLTEEFDFDTEIKKATTIYAGWVEITAENSIVLVIDEKTATVFGEEIENDVAPLIVNERTMLPARFVAESLGANVEWDEETEKVTITKGEKVIEIFIGKTYAMVDGKEVDLDAPAFLENSRTYTPIRFISEELGAYVNWDDETKTVTITKIQ